MVRARRAGAPGPTVEAASRRRAGAALALIGALLAGCGGSSGAVTNVRDAVLRVDDVPTGYKPAPHRDFAPQLSRSEQAAFLQCTGLPRWFVDRDADDVPRADSPDFTYGRFAGGPAQRIASSVRLFPSAEEVRAALARVDRDEAVQCFAPMFRAGFAKGLAIRPGVTTSDFTVRPLSLGGIGDQSAAFQAIATMHTRGGPVQQDLDLYFVRAGRALVTMYTGGFDSPTDQRLNEVLLSTIASRLGGAR